MFEDTKDPSEIQDAQQPVDWSEYAETNGHDNQAGDNKQQQQLYCPNEPDDDDDDSDFGLDHNVIFDDLQLFFHSIDEPQFIDKFVEQKVTLKSLLELNEDDLVKCGIELVGDRKKILDHIAELHSGPWVPTSLHDMTAKSMLTSPGYYITLNDVNRHQAYIGALFIFMARKLTEDPDLLTYGKDYVGIKKVISEAEDLRVTCVETINKLERLMGHLYKHSDEPIYQPTNFIDTDRVKRVRNRHVAIRVAKRLGLLATGAFIVYKMVTLSSSRLWST